MMPLVWCAIALSGVSLAVSVAVAVRYRPSRRAVRVASHAVPGGVTHYWVGHDEHAVYDGYDSDIAYQWHLAMERNPGDYPGRHRYLENGRARVDRHHTEIK